MLDSWWIIVIFWWLMIVSLWLIVISWWLLRGSLVLSQDSTTKLNYQKKESQK
jgi:predicted tellurium resistance membrane protein TerC